MRQIILDTETTGLEWKKGNRIVEIGCVELFKRRPTGNNYHQYIKPDCEFEQGAQEVTGLTRSFWLTSRTSRRSPMNSLPSSMAPS